MYFFYFTHPDNSFIFMSLAAALGLYLIMDQVFW